jgi:hypothetical protein
MGCKNKKRIAKVPKLLSRRDLDMDGISANGESFHFGKCQEMLHRYGNIRRLRQSAQQQ